MKKKVDWNVALEKFLTPLEKRPIIAGALVTGSHAIGTQSTNSDIDIHLILAKGTPWRERGNCYIDGYLIEYFMNSIAQLTEYRKSDFKEYSRTDARMFALGRILFDKTGELTNFQKSAKKELLREFPKRSASEVELGKYSLWDELDNLQDLEKANSPAYDYCHKLLLNRALEVYRKFLRIDVGATSKIYRYFTEPDFRKRYSLTVFPDTRFSTLFVDCLTDNSFRKIAALVNHSNKKMGGLELEGWKARTHSVK